MVWCFHCGSCGSWKLWLWKLCCSSKLFITSLCTKLCNEQPRINFSRISVNIDHEPPQEPHSHTLSPLLRHCFRPSPSRTSKGVRQAFTQQLYHLSLRQRQKHNNYFLRHSLYCTCHSLFASHIFPCIFSTISYSHLFFLSSSCDFFPYSDVTLI